ncbi:MAG: ribbon-helix-helix domain-containing protein [Burkholderiales bacterium]|nr:ribbon-helix-helix domain-containing protein [Burkholderiales bacterium]
MRTAISIPEDVFRSAEELAERLGISRSELYSKAVSQLVAKHRDATVTARLNDVYGPGGEDSSLESGTADLQYRSLSRNP